MKRRRAVLIGMGVAVLAACNAITGAHDRFLDDTANDGGGATTKDHAVADDDDDVVTKPPFDAGPDVDANSIRTIRLTGNDQWSTPNGATYAAVPAGVTIEDAAPSAGHAVVLPLAMPALPTADYTMLVGIDVRKDCEFGIMTRVRANGQGIIYGSRISNGVTPLQPFLGRIGPPNWGPAAITQADGTQYDLILPSHYFMKVVANDKLVTGTVWRDGENEPAAQTLFQDLFDAGDRGTGVGVYEYFFGGANDVTFTDITITYVAP